MLKYVMEYTPLIGPCYCIGAKLLRRTQSSTLALSKTELIFMLNEDRSDYWLLCDGNNATPLRLRHYLGNVAKRSTRFSGIYISILSVTRPGSMVLEPTVSSRQMSPKKSLWVQLVDNGELVAGVVDRGGGSVGSRQSPNQPKCSQLPVDDKCVCVEVVVTVGTGTGEGVGVVTLVSSSLSSKQPNHPGVLHDDVEDVFVLVFVVVFSVVVSSKQPNQPGVLQVSVLLVVDVEVVVGIVKDVVLSVPLLSKNSQG